jgi:hypothetical protein
MREKKYQLIIAHCNGVLEYTFPSGTLHVLYDWAQGDMTYGNKVRMMWDDLDARVFSFQPGFSEMGRNEIGCELLEKFGNNLEHKTKHVFGPIAVLTLMP